MIDLMTFDPGIDTGLAWIEENGPAKDYNSCTIGPETAMESDDATDLQRIRDHIVVYRPKRVAYEDFKHRPNLMKAELYSLQIIGVIRLTCQDLGIPHETKWLPSTAKAFWNDNKIKAIGLWKPGKKHEMDAMRVLLKCRQQTEPEWFSEITKELRGIV